jgi:glutathione S-transferase
MITLYQFGPAWNMPDPSPFCTKVITYLRLAKIPFETAAGTNYLRRSPKGKLPFIDADGERVADSSFIIPYLQAKHGNPLRELEDGREKSALRGITRMLDEDLYFVLVYFRWLDEGNWNEFTRPRFFGSLPWPLSSLVPALVRRNLKKSLHHQGLGRHTPSEITTIGRHNLEAVRDYLGDRPFIAGGTPCVADATVYAFLSGIATPPHRSELKEFVLSEPTLTAYIERVDGELAKA